MRYKTGQEAPMSGTGIQMVPVRRCPRRRSGSSTLRKARTSRLSGRATKVLIGG